MPPSPDFLPLYNGALKNLACDLVVELLLNLCEAIGVIASTVR